MENKLNFRICLVVLIVLLSILTMKSIGHLLTNTYARYIGSRGGTSPVEVAVPIVTDTFEEIALPLDSMIPGETKIYNFAIKNFDNLNQITETVMNYYIKIEGTNYLPITYQLQKETSAPGTYTDDILTSGISPTYTLPHSLATTHNFRLIIVWNANDDAYDYANLVDIVTITIDAEQKID